MESKYSPGPWTWMTRKQPPYRPGFYHNGRIVSGDDMICDFGGSEGAYDESTDFEGDRPSDADRALILAAPRMYELLNAALRYIAEDAVFEAADDLLLRLIPIAGPPRPLETK